MAVPETDSDDRPATAETPPQLLYPVRGRTPQPDPEIRLLSHPVVTHTSLSPRDGGYVVPVTAVVRKADALEAGVDVAVRLTVDV